MALKVYVERITQESASTAVSHSLGNIEYLHGQVEIPVGIILLPKQETSVRIGDLTQFTLEIRML